MADNFHHSLPTPDSFAYTLDPESRFELRILDLPPFAQDGIARIERASAVQHGLNEARSAKRTMLQDAARNAARALKDFDATMAMPNAKKSKKDDEIRAKLAGRVESTKAEVVRFVENDTRSGSLPLRTIREWLEYADGRRWRLIEASPPAITSSPKDIIKAIESKRAEIAEAAEAAKRAQLTGLSREDAERQAVADIDALAAHGAPNIGAVWTRQRIGGRRVQRSIIWPNEMDDAYPRPGVAFCAWLFRDQLVERVKRELDAHADSGLSAADIDAAARAARGKILELERVEESLIRVAEDQGAQIFRRPFADPRAVLGIEVEGVDLESFLVRDLP